MAKNIEHVFFLRNGNAYPNRETALAGLNNNISKVGDGEFILARYASGDTIATITGIKHEISGKTGFTFIDLEGASADVEQLKEEINAKLGTGITSSNTATAQLAALSGNSSTDTSATTSVEGAKKYAKDYTDEQIGELEYTGVTTGTGVYVTNVTEADGVVSATTATLPSLAEVHVDGKPIIAVAEDKGQLAASAGTINAEFVNVTGDTFTATTVQAALEEVKDAIGTAISGLDKSDSAEAKKFVIKVDETDGVIETTKGSITSDDKTVTLTDNADGGVDFSVNVDGETLIVNTGTGVISVASAALVQYEGDDDTIEIGAESEGVRIVSSPLTIQKVTTGLSEEVKEEYHLVGAAGTTIGDPVKIYKDSHIVSINYISGSTDPHYQNLEYVYIDASGNTHTTYVDMSMLVLEAEFASGLTIENHVARGVVDTTSEKDGNNVAFLTVGADGFKVSGIKDEIDRKINALDAVQSGDSNHINIGVIQEDGIIVGVNVDENNIADADDLEALSGKTVTEVESSNSSISAETAETTDGTVKYDLTTDASKIKMTGFTAAESGFTAITSASTITEAVKAIETEIIANEQTVAASLNDLNSRVNTISGNVETISGDVNTVKTQYVSGVSVNGNAVTVSNHVAPISISGATSSLTAQTTNAIVVDTDANGNITLGLNYIDCGTYDD